jgi:putative phosphoesterase
MSPRMASRLGLIGDVHAEPELLDATIRFLTSRGVEGLLCTGDVVDGAGDAAVCCELLSASEVFTVRGNHDRWFLAGRMRDVEGATQPDTFPEEGRAYLSSLPTTLEISTVSGELLLCHGMGENDLGRLGPDDEGYALDTNSDLQGLLRSGKYRLIIAGHTHLQFVRGFRSAAVINPGTLARAERPGFMLLDLADALVELYTFEGTTLREAGQVPLPLES